MNHPRYDYQGVIGLPNIAKAFGVNVSTLRSRMRRGLSLKEAVEKSSPPQTNTIKPRPIAAKKPKRSHPVTSPDLLSDAWKRALGIKAPERGGHPPGASEQDDSE
ncbi:hypothetical protein [Vibrio coralliilyticus]|uniref:hypothetical protein n=1 Tax=Vibrio coralliilyticus TaxID=190893 RepID=UPI00185C4DF4|nr:hypothetical protein [Vibrio coralliilyticus]NUW66921.1 hypothetical protein [Vibrio coralliilyticus]NUW70891.1 hypothetical protein [Vibrio coralliilyticus]